MPIITPKPPARTTSTTTPPAAPASATSATTPASLAPSSPPPPAADYAGAGSASLSDVTRLRTPPQGMSALALRTGADPLSSDPTVNAALREIRALHVDHTDRAEEARILEILGGLSGSALNEVIAKVELGKLVEDIDDRLIGPDNRARLFTLLGQERVAELSVVSRAHIIEALQIGDTDPQKERLIRDLFVATHGTDLTELKTRIDLSTDHHDLCEMLFHDIDSKDIKDEIVAHIASASPPPTGEYKVMSDIDDTFYANWLDTRYPKKTVYPGVGAFYMALDRGPTGKGFEGDLLFLTARPGDRIGFMEGKTQETLTKHGVPPRAVLTGDLNGIFGNEVIAEKKVENFVRHQRLFPEQRYVFIGDSGQGDHMAGRSMRTHNADRFDAAFIHNVNDVPADVKAKDAALGVHYFDTYIGAAKKAFELGLIGPDGLRAVATQAMKDLAATKFDSDAQKAARYEDHRRDLDAVNALLAPAPPVVA